MRSRRGRERRSSSPGQLVAWDPSDAHAGTAVDGRPWTSRLIVVEAADLAALAGDAEIAPLNGGSRSPEPVLADPVLPADFLRMHRRSSVRPRGSSATSGWRSGCATLVERSSAVRPRRAPLTPRDERALRLARDYLGDLPRRTIRLDELAAAAGIGKFRLIRLVPRAHRICRRTRFQVAHRIRAARRLLEAGTPIAEAAAPPDSPTRAICTATSGAAWESRRASISGASCRRDAAPDELRPRRPARPPAFSTESSSPGKRASSSARRSEMYLHTPCCRSAVTPGGAAS